MAVLCLLLAAACCYDYRGNRIPNYLIVLAAIWGLGWRFGGGGPAEALGFAAEALLLMALLYPLFKIGAIGAGDVKLLGVTAGYLPFDKILVFLFFSLLIAAVISLFKMWKESNFGERMQYLARYLVDVAESGSWQLYLENVRDRRRAGICLSGPVFVSMLLYWGGVY